MGRAFQIRMKILEMIVTRFMVFRLRMYICVMIRD